MRLNIAALITELAKPDHYLDRVGKSGNVINGVRGILADAMDEADRPEEAKLLRTNGQHIVIQNGRIIPGAFKYRHVIYYQYLPSELETIYHDYEDSGVEMMTEWVHDNEDNGNGDLSDETSSRPSREYKGCIQIRGLRSGESYCGWLGLDGTFHVEHLMEAPADAFHVDDRGRFTIYQNNRRIERTG